MTILTKEMKNILAKDVNLHHSDSSRSIQSTRSIVSFTTIAVHEHPMILSGGRSASGGPAVELDWNSQSESTMSLDDFEATRLRRRRKSAPELMIPGSFRTAILLESGYTINEIKESTTQTPPPKASLRKSISSKVLRILKSRSSKNFP